MMVDKYGFSNAEDALETFVSNIDSPGARGLDVERAAHYLGHLADPRGIDAALEALRDGVMPRWWYPALQLLELARSERAIPTLVHFRSYGALSRIGSPDAVEAVMSRARRWLDDPTYAGYHPQRYNGEFLVPALCRIGTPEAIDIVLQMTAMTPVLWKEPAAYAVARVADERFTPYLLELCAGPRRRAGLRGLERVGNRRAEPALFHMFLTSPDRQARRAVVKAMARATTPRWGSEVVGHSWVHPDVLLRRDFAWYLGHVERRDAGTHYDEPAHAARLADKLLGDPDDLVRAQATRSLGLLDRGFGPRLTEMLDDPFYRVRANAATALARLGESTAVEVLRLHAEADEVACVRDAAAAAVRSLAAREQPERHEYRTFWRKPARVLDVKTLGRWLEGHQPRA